MSSISNYSTETFCNNFRELKFNKEKVLLIVVGLLAASSIAFGIYNSHLAQIILGGSVLGVEGLLILGIFLSSNRTRKNKIDIDDVSTINTSINNTGKCFLFQQNVINKICYSYVEGTAGSTNTETVNQAFKEITEKTKSIMGISFEKKRIEQECSGGICSALSFEFLSKYFKLKASCNETGPAFFQKLVSIGQYCSQGSEELRSRQVVFNSICVNTIFGEEAAKGKVEALARFHDLSVVDFKNEIQLICPNDLSKVNIIKKSPRPLNVTKRPVYKAMSQLDDGAYLLRLIKCAINHKQEDYGHSVVYIKEGDYHLYFDPNFGLRCYKGEEGQKRIVKNLYVDEDNGINPDHSCLVDFLTNEFGVYKLKPSAN